MALDTNDSICCWRHLSIANICFATEKCTEHDAIVCERTADVSATSDCESPQMHNDTMYSMLIPSFTRQPCNYTINLCTAQFADCFSPIGKNAIGTYRVLSESISGAMNKSTNLSVSLMLDHKLRHWRHCFHSQIREPHFGMSRKKKKLKADCIAEIVNWNSVTSSPMEHSVWCKLIKVVITRVRLQWI